MEITLIDIANLVQVFGIVKSVQVKQHVPSVEVNFCKMVNVLSLKIVYRVHIQIVQKKNAILVIIIVLLAVHLQPKIAFHALHLNTYLKTSNFIKNITLKKLI